MGLKYEYEQEETGLVPGLYKDLISAKVFCTIKCLCHILSFQPRLKKPLAPSSGQVQTYKMTKNSLYVMEKLLPSDIPKLINQITTTSHILLWLSRCCISLKTNQ